MTRNASWGGWGPLRQSPDCGALSAALMLALDAVGRRAEALHRFAATRQWLRAELGAEPGPQLRAVHLSLLRSA